MVVLLLVPMGVIAGCGGGASGDPDMGSPGDPFTGLPAGRLAARISASREVARVPASDAPTTDGESVLSADVEGSVTAWRWTVYESEDGEVVFRSREEEPTFTCPEGRAAYDVRLDVTDGEVVSSHHERRLITCVLPRTANGRPVFEVDIADGSYFQEGEIGGETVPPGALIRVSGTATGQNLAFFNFQGTAQAPIHIINDGAVTNADAAWGFHLINCRHVIVDGFGDDSVPYGFVLDNGTNDGGQVFWVRFYTQGENTIAAPTGIEVYGVHVRQGPGTGIQVSTDGSEQFNRGNWTHEDLRIHHNRVEDVGDEGFYIGYFTDGVDPAPHKMERSRIYRNHIENTGWDGLQVSNSVDLEVHHNVVVDAGRENTANQRSVMQVNSGNRDAWFFRNTLIGTMEGGVDVQVGCTGGDLTFFGNTMEAPNGVYVHGGASDGPEVRFLHNTFAFEATEAVQLNRNAAPPSCMGTGTPVQRVDAAFNLALLGDGQAFFDVVAGTDDSASWTLSPNLVVPAGDRGPLCLSGAGATPPYAPTCGTSTAFGTPGSALDTLGLDAADFPGGVLTDNAGNVLNVASGFGAHVHVAP